MQQLAQTDGGGVKLQLDGLGVAGLAAAHRVVTGLGHVAVAIARLHIQHALDAHKHRFGTPEAPSGQHNGFGMAHFLIQLKKSAADTGQLPPQQAYTQQRTR